MNNHNDYTQMMRESIAGVSGLAAGRTRYLRALTAMSRVVAVYAGGVGKDDRHQRHCRGADILAALCRRNGAFWVKAAQFSHRWTVLPLDPPSTATFRQVPGPFARFRCGVDFPESPFPIRAP